MVTTKIVLRQKLYKDSSKPLAIRVTKDRKSTYFYLFRISECDWDATKQRVRKSNPNSNRLNNFILKRLSEINDRVLDIESEKGEFNNLKASLRPLQGGTSFRHFAHNYLELLEKSGKYNQLVSDRPRIKAFLEFVKEKDFKFAQITVTLLRKFCAHLKAKKNINERTIANYLLVIRTLYNQAIKSKAANSKDYPFGKDKVVIKFPESIKLGLTIEEVVRIDKLDLQHYPKLFHARNLWLFSFYFAGMRISDILRLKWTDFQNDRLYYAMGKNSKADSLKVSEKAQLILLRYQSIKKENNGLVFPDLSHLESLDNRYQVQRAISYATKRIDKALYEVAVLANISKPLTMHIARHTFGNISGDKISPQMLQKLYRHSSITTTIGYQANFLHKDADEALNAVIEF